MIKGVNLLENVGQFRVVLLQFHHFGLKLSIGYFYLREKGKLDIVNLCA